MDLEVERLGADPNGLQRTRTELLTPQLKVVYAVLTYDCETFTGRRQLRAFKAEELHSTSFFSTELISDAYEPQGFGGVYRLRPLPPTSKLG